MYTKEKVLVAKVKNSFENIETIRESINVLIDYFEKNGSDSEDAIVEFQNILSNATETLSSLRKEKYPLVYIYSPT